MLGALLLLGACYEGNSVDAEGADTEGSGSGPGGGGEGGSDDDSGGADDSAGQASACGDAPSPGAAPIRRLTPFELDNTLFVSMLHAMEQTDTDTFGLPELCQGPLDELT